MKITFILLGVLVFLIILIGACPFPTAAYPPGGYDPDNTECWVKGLDTPEFITHPAYGGGSHVPRCWQCWHQLEYDKDFFHKDVRISADVTLHLDYCYYKCPKCGYTNWR